MASDPINTIYLSLSPDAYAREKGKTIGQNQTTMPAFSFNIPTEQKASFIYNTIDDLSKILRSLQKLTSRQMNICDLHTLCPFLT